VGKNRIKFFIKLRFVTLAKCLCHFNVTYLKVKGV
jgi:hypothetical protein